METGPLAARNVALLFDDETNERFIDLSATVANTVQSEIRLDLAEMLPHVSLYNVLYPEKNLDAVSLAVQTIARKTRAFMMRFNEKETVAGNTFINAHLSFQLTDIHKQVMDALNPLRENAFDPEWLKDPTLSDEMRENILHYGGVLVAQLFKPHVTAARAMNPDDQEKALAALPAEIDFTVTPHSIALVKTGPFGTCESIIEKFPLR